MRARLLLLVLAAYGLYGQTEAKQLITEFAGFHVRIVRAKVDENGFPQGPAGVCFESSAKPQCYMAPGFYGLGPNLTRIDLGRNQAAILFSATQWFGAASGNVYALLRPDSEYGLQALFPSDITLSSEGRQAFWSDPSISDDPIFVTAAEVWALGEGHYGAHRYIVSSYILGSPVGPCDDSDPAGCRYLLGDQYMTARRYDPTFDKDDVLGMERQEIIARLKRIKAERERQAKAPN